MSDIDNELDALSGDDFSALDNLEEEPSRPGTEELEEIEEIEAIEAIPAGPAVPPPISSGPKPPPRRQGGEDSVIKSEVTAEDLAFLQRVFTSVRGVNTSAPPPRPAKTHLDGPDAKIQQLREKLHERERDLAIIAQIWQVKQREFDNADQMLSSRDARIASIENDLNQVRTAYSAYRQETTADLESRQATIEQLEADIASLRETKDNEIAELQNTLAEKEQDTIKKMEMA